MLAEELAESPVFVVKVDVNTQNDIRVLVDNDLGISIDDCVKVSRFIEGSFDREVEDFSLQVSSPGLDHPLMVTRQYVKNVGREVQVKTLEGETLKGKLEAADDQEIALFWTEKERIEGKKAKQTVEKRRQIKYDEIKETLVVISFK
jgi:ribosome maturation factor RimP